MRILELDLKAFGPFTEKRLELGDGSPGLCVIHGANEAGKSSALRAIHDLLYGIPARSPDDFLHRYADLRIGARLRFADGEELAFVRRKGNKDTIQCYEGDADPPRARLEELQRAVPEPVFLNFYGLDHEGLSRGSQALLDDDGELGRTLYAAGLGAGNLRALLAELESEAEALFTPRGRLRSINARLADLKQIQARLRQESLRPRAWEEAKKAEQEACARRAALEASHEQQRARLARLRRIQRTLPGLARRRQWLAKQAALPRLPELGLDFGERLRTLRSRRQTLIEACDEDRASRSRLETRLAELPLAPALLAEESAIRALQAGWGAVARELEDLPRREADLDRLEREIRVRWTAIDPAGALRARDRLPELLGRGRRLRELAQEYRALEETAAHDRERSTTAEARLESLDRALSQEAEAIGEVESAGLRRAIRQAESLGDIDARIASLDQQVVRFAAAASQGYASLGTSLPAADPLEHALIPEPSVLEQAVSIERRLGLRAEKLAEAEEARETERRAAEEDLARLRGERTLPSEAELRLRRQRRDALWDRIRHAWESGVPPAEAGSLAALEESEPSSLPDAYQGRVGRADELADRLRGDAERLAREAALVARLERLEADARRGREQRVQLESERAAQQQAWHRLWSTLGIEPGSPAEMVSWRARFEQWLERVRRRREAEAALAREVGARRAVREALDRALRLLPPELRGPHVAEPIAPSGAGRDDAESSAQRGSSASGDPLAPRLDLARVALDRLESVGARRARLIESRDAAEREGAEAERAQRRSAARLESWQVEWQAAVEGLGFEAAPRTDEALDRLDALREIDGLTGKRAEIADRIAKMRRDIERFGAELEAVVQQLAPDLASGGATREQQVQHLQERLEAARTAEARRLDLLAERVEVTDRIEAAEQTLRTLAAQRAALCAEAEVGDEAELDPVLKACEEREEIGRELAGLERSLVEMGDGLAIEALAAEAEGEDPDVLRGRIEDLESEIEAQAKEVEAIRETMARARATLQTMDGRAEMAELAAAAESERATIQREVERYAVLRLAHAILGREVERYRREHQTPVLTRARRIFQRLTRGAWPQLEVDYDEAGRAELVGVRQQGLGAGPTRRVRIEAMSSGTRDQLFLALRLATLEDALERAEPMPLVADDILVHFDDARSQAGLEVLADLGQRTQILLFTHHARVRDQARALGERARILELEGDASDAA